eukprot:SAG22_NODE_7976_length_694_cov_0.531092_1_plen_199_part_01
MPTATHMRLLALATALQLAGAASSAASGAACPARMYAGQCYHCRSSAAGTAPALPPCQQLSGSAVADAAACCEFCTAAKGCELWTFQGGTNSSASNCYLKKKSAAGSDPLPTACGEDAASGAMPPAPPPSGTPPPPPPAPTPLPAAPPGGFKNVLFIAVDDLRPEIGAYGHSYMVTPHLDQFAKESTVFTRAYVQYSFC